MARYSRIYFKNAVYHVCIRGNNRQPVLKGDENKFLFLESLSGFKSRFGFKLYGFVLMDNHAHLIVETSDTINISKIMQAVTLSYSVKFRKRHSYSGYVWQGRFKSNVIEDDRHIIECINYIHNNPVRAGIVEKDEDYPWSSYSFYNDLDSKVGDLINIDKFDG